MELPEKFKKRLGVLTGMQWFILFMGGIIGFLTGIDNPQKAQEAPVWVVLGVILLALSRKTKSFPTACLGAGSYFTLLALGLAFGA